MTVKFGTSGNDHFGGGNGVDIYFGGGGHDRISGGGGSDVLDGGSGSDRVSGDAGSDMLVYVAAESAGATDIYDGGSQADGLTLVLTRAEWMNAKVQADVARYLQFLAVQVNPRTAEAGGAEFRFTAFDLRVTRVEALFVVVDGVVIDPRDGGVTLVADAMSASEDKASAAIDLLANDKVSDLVRGVTHTQGARGSVAIAFTPGGGDRPAKAEAVYTPASSWQSLALGQTGTDSFTYTVTDADGDSATQTVTVTITGTNDGPIAVADIATTSENQALAIDVLANDSDVDAGAVLTLTGVSGPAGKGIASVAGNKLQFAPGADFDHLAAGATESVVLSYTIADEHGAVATGSVTITVTGTNDAPVVTSSAADASGAVVEAGEDSNGQTSDGRPVASGALTASDVDDGATATWSGDTTGTYGRFAISAAGAWTYTLDNRLADALAAGDTRTESFTATVADGQGGTATQIVTVTITGTNDAPEVTSGVAAGTVIEAGHADDGSAVAGTPTASGTFTASDVDAGATVTWSGSAEGLHGTFTIDAAGTWTYALDNDRAATQFLGEGQGWVEKFIATVTDDRGATASRLVTITILGTNDKPVVTSSVAAASGSVVEAGIDGNGAGAAGGSVATGTLTSSDVDDGATATWSGDAAGTYGRFAIDAAGTWTYTLDDADADTQGLGAGETRTESFTTTVTDNKGASAEQIVTITVTGTNDAPVAAADAGEATEDGPIVTGSVAGNDRDPDRGATLSYALTGEVPAGLTLDADGRWAFDPSHAAYQDLAAGATRSVTATYTVSDGAGGTASSTLTIIVTGANDAPVAAADTGTASEDGAVVTGSVATNDRDPDAGDTLVFSLVDPAPAGFALAADGGWSFDPTSSDRAALANGETSTLVIAYSATDGSGASSQATLTLTITGSNDAPVVTSSDNGRVTEDLVASASGSILYTDPDARGAPVITVAPAPTSYLGTFNAAAGTTGRVEWIFAVDNAALQYLAARQTLTQSYAVTIADGQGGSVTQTVVVEIVGVNDEIVRGEVVAANFTDVDGIRSGTTRIYFTDADAADVHTVSLLSRTEGAIDGATVVLVEDGPDGRSYIDINYAFSIEEIATLSNEALLQRYRATIFDGEGGQLVSNRVVTLEDVDYFIGDAGQNDLVGFSNRRNVIVGGDGTDRLVGGALHDELYGDAGPALPDDEVNDYEGDVLVGDKAYDDLLVGNGGADTMTGGKGADWFYFDPGEADGDIIRDFSGSSDGRGGIGEGDSLNFFGYGEGAFFRKVDATHFEVVSGDGTTIETITFSNAPDIQPGDVFFF